MTSAQSVTAASPQSSSFADRVELCGFAAVIGMAVFTQLSIAVAQSLLTIAALCWVALLIARRERFEAPRFFWPLILYAGATLIASAFSAQPRASFVDSKQLVLFLIVPIVYRLVAAGRGSTLLTAVISAGAASAALGIFQYGLLHYDQLSQRPQGTLGHYMTYSGLLMLVMGVALSRILFGRHERLWAALVLPALAFAVALTFSRNAWVGVSAAAALLLSLKDFRLLAALPVAAAIVFGAAPSSVNQRFFSIFDLNDPTNRDRVAMMREGEHMIRNHPLVGIGPNMVKELYAEYRDPEAVEKVNPHLHNVPLQIAAERGLPALAVWLLFIGVLAVDVGREFRSGRHRVLAAAALAALVSTLAAGLFEYNFGDSEFLMLFLILVTLPFASARSTAPALQA